ncbi:DeoR/GlpR family DNA-binding transcription regulator [Rubrivivax gelatinosus]|uniref:Transcriptional regulator, DeoR family n=1 Tax=Rubrivivax gelatinosus (strain NBRC 100245 / IL144) TaxID=983917 RepID=I0HSM5_RUBGI|nr:DeoR/GlpR family DNA-binding transcription regulator [Rubrivivax gelatinosus]BAL96012.1 transcriptional regulator, DeoR family [Rubrivivax gelatinosus IL144]
MEAHDVPLARRDLIAARLAAGQGVAAAALAAEFSVSEDAIRRDLRALAAEGRCRRVYGGALPPAPGGLPMAARSGVDIVRKRALARAAAATVRRGEFLFLDNGSTNLVLAELLPEDHELTVATNSVDIAAALLRRQDLRLLMLGGIVDPTVGGCVDATALLALQRLDVDRAFVGACAISAETGASAHDAADAEFKRALLAASRERVVMVTNDKLGTRAPHRFAALQALGTVIVEHDADAAALAAAGATLCRADAPV